MREEYRTSIFRGVCAGAFVAATWFFANWTGPIDQELVRGTVSAGLVAATPFLGFGVRDARRNDKL